MICHVCNSLAVWLIIGNEWPLLHQAWEVQAYLPPSVYCSISIPCDSRGLEPWGEGEGGEWD